MLTPQDAYSRIHRLTETLRPIASRDPEQEVRGMAVPVMFAVLEAAKVALPNDPIVRAAWDQFSPELLIDEDPVRAVDALLVAEQLQEALYEPPLPESFGSSMFDPPDRW
jgi:hypothetical protein